MTTIRLMMFLAVSLAMTPFAAQGGLFDPVARVNGKVITQYELDQRILFLSVMNIPGDLEEDALSRLINERLQSDAARRAGISISENALLGGMEEYASRSGMNAEQFIQALGRAGISRETFADFVRAGLEWRQLVRGLFSSRVQISEAEIDRAMALGSLGSGARVLVSEIFLPADTPERKADALRLAAEISELETASRFAEAARSYSVAPSARQGGQQDWVSVQNLPAAYRNQILSLSPGQITDPIPLPNAIAIFQLHGIEESGHSREEAVSVDYVTYSVPGSWSDAERERTREVLAEADTCDDLYGIARQQPEIWLRRNVSRIDELPRSIVDALETLDENEMSSSLVTDDEGRPAFLMLCGRDIRGNRGR